MKKIICTLLLVLSIIIMVSGLTLSYFSDQSNQVQIPFTTGILEMEIEDLPGDEENWVPGAGNAKNLEWSFRNIGTQPAKLRVKIEKNWNPGELEDIVVWEQNSSWSLQGEYYLYDNPVNPDEAVGLDFDVWLNMDMNNLNEAYNAAEYQIKLTLEAIQEEGSWE